VGAATATTLRNARNALSTKQDAARTQREWAKAHPERYAAIMRRSHLKTTFGLTEEAYEALLRGQGGVCAICKLPERSHSRFGKVLRMAVDHDHETGAVRGLLCFRCNTALGYFETQRDAILAYLARTV